MSERQHQLRIREGQLRGDKVHGQFVIDVDDLGAFLAGVPNSAPGPVAWATSASGETMPDVLPAIWRSRVDN